MKVIGAIGHKNYTSETNLLKRRAFADYSRPKIDLNTELIKRLKLKGKEKILDVGCGNGSLLRDIRTKKKHVGELFGVEIAEGILKPGIQADRKQKTKIKYAQGDARKLHFPDDTFDIVILKHVLHNIPDHKNAIKECRRVLKTGGRLAIVLTGKKTRMVQRALRPKIAKLLGINFFIDPEKYVNLENIKSQMGKKWKDLRITSLKSTMKLKSSQPYVDYIDAGRSFWGNISDKKWQEAMDLVRRYLDLIIKRKKVIHDMTTYGIVVAKK
ncbi:MAG: class I SAM-dependent methyltransferase [Patescibacteria group bacterium]